MVIKRSLIFIAILFSCPSWLINKTTVLFSPDDAPTNTLLTMINDARKRVYVAMYMFTDKRIAVALIKAKQRKLDVQVILDETSTNEVFFGKASFLARQGVPVRIFAPPQQSTSRFNAKPLMHNKFALIDCVVWTGSFNWTCKANNANQENVLICDELPLIKRYRDHFEVLKQRSVPFVVTSTGLYKKVNVKKFHQ